MAERDVLNAVIAQLASDVADLEVEVVTYREMSQVLLAQNAELLKQHAALRQQISDRREEMRRFIAGAVSA